MGSLLLLYFASGYYIPMFVTFKQVTLIELISLQTRKIRDKVLNLYLNDSIIFLCTIPELSFNNRITWQNLKIQKRT